MRMRYAIVVVLGCVAIAFAAFRLTSSSDPVYAGRPLSEWVLSYSYLTPPEGTPSENEADEALRRAGTNAVPFLLRWMRCEPPAWKRPVRTLAPAFVQHALNVDEFTSGELLAEKSVRAFGALGTNGLVGMPALVQLMRDTNAPDSAYRAMRCLAALGTNGLPPLISVIEDAQSPFRTRAISAVRRVHTNAESKRVLGPVLLRCATDPAADVLPIGLAGLWLSDVKYDPRISIPALTSVLTNTAAREVTRMLAAKTMGGYGALAAEALPTLTNALVDPAPAIGHAASNAIWKITTDLATNGPAR
jgi:hypothetical protein